MTYLLDTNVISEWSKPRPDAGVVAWLDAAAEDALYLSVVTFGEIRLGIELLPDGRKRERITAWLDDDLAERFDGRILDVDRDIAKAWAKLIARGRALGARPPVLDAFLAATALVRGMILVTRNERDVARLEVPFLNPWRS